LGEVNNIRALLILIISICCVQESGARHFFSEEESKHISSSIHFADHSQWDKAFYHAKIVEDPLVYKIVQWLRLKDEKSTVSFAEIKKFLEENPKWFDQRALKKRAEDLLLKDKTISNKEMLTWLEMNAPYSSSGKVKLVRLKYENNGESKELVKRIKSVWVSADFSVKQDEKEYLNIFSHMLNEEDHIERISSLLWRKKVTQAKRLLSRVSADHQKLFRARMKLIIKSKFGVARAVSSVPKSLKEDEGLLYDYISWHEFKNNHDQVKQLLNKISDERALSSRSWWKIKNRQIRSFIQREDFSMAYELASSKGLQTAADYANAQWLSGWVALRHLKKPDSALVHFRNMYNRVKLPVSQSRGAYWTARAYEAKGDATAASKWYRIASVHPTTFYGQLGKLNVDRNSFFNFPKIPEPTKVDIDKFSKNNLVKLACILSYSKHSNLAQWFIVRAVKKARTIGEISLITKVGIDLDKYNLSIEASKHASYNGIFAIENGYPTIDVGKDHDVDKALILSIIRQESLFNSSAVSNAGAVGLMQLMPHTAKSMSRELKHSFSDNKLKNKPFNMRLGVYYLSKLIKHYDGSYILAIAAYNAGQHNVKRWINKNGDPRKMNNTHDIIDWIESITFYETRNYVQRVIESLQVYRDVLSDDDKPCAIDTSRDLARSGGVERL
jgi:peptidoglycan lytic transglycosylase